MENIKNEKCDVFEEMRLEWAQLYERECVKDLFKGSTSEITLLDILMTVTQNEQSQVIRGLKYRCDKWRKIVSKAGDDNNDLRAELEDVRSKSTQVAEKYSLSCGEKKTLESQNAVLKSEIETLRIKVKHSKSDLDREILMKEVYKNHLDNLKEEIADLKSKVNLYKDMDRSLQCGPSKMAKLEVDEPSEAEVGGNGYPRKPNFVYNRMSTIDLPETSDLFHEHVIDTGTESYDPTEASQSLEEMDETQVE